MTRDNIAANPVHAIPSASRVGVLMDTEISSGNSRINRNSPQVLLQRLTMNGLSSWQEVHQNDTVIRILPALHYMKHTPRYVRCDLSSG